MDTREWIHALGLSAIALFVSGGFRRSALAAEVASAESIRPIGQMFLAPDNPKEWPAFRDSLTRWRTAERTHLRYDDRSYRQPEFAWAAEAYCSYFLMLLDQSFYDSQENKFKVDEFVDRARREFGGIDSVILWHAYPRIGVDQRNQYDFYRDQPGGLAGLRAVVARFHEHGVRSYIDYNPWDTATNRESQSDVEMLLTMVRALDVDGVYLDTLPQGPAGLRAGLDAIRPGLIIEGEGSVPLEEIVDYHASWAQGEVPGTQDVKPAAFTDSAVPGVLAHKWLERRHMQHQVRRWDHDHLGEIHIAWMNGSGIVVWENVFGSLMPWNERDKSILRSILPIQRRFTRVFQGEGWVPLVPTIHDGLYASQWNQDGLRLWTLVNRQWTDFTGPLMSVPHVEGHVYFDLVRGRAVQPATDHGSVEIHGEIVPRGVGGFVSGPPKVFGEDFRSFLAAQAKLWTSSNWNDSTPTIRTDLQDVAKPPGASNLPNGMVTVPAASFEQIKKMDIRECGLYDSAPPDCTQKDLLFCYMRPESIASNRRHVHFRKFAIDEALVTNRDYAAFLSDSGYTPLHPENFLRHWAAGAPAKEILDHPVVYVDLTDARAYARWAGKRLPTEEEWQYAAQGTDGRIFPWGNEMDEHRCNTGRTGGTMPVKAFPNGRSPFGCFDMTGNVWQWTESERSDGRTRFCVIRGGAWFNAVGSIWYVKGGPQPVDHATKYLLMWAGLDRCSTIGFRCAVDMD
jgi:formylglycine-generating enzyme required for sulfatase activity